MQDDLSTVAAKASPTVAYLGATFAGLSLPDWAALLAIIYTAGLLMQMSWRFGVFLEKKWHARAAKRRIPDDSDQYGDGGV